MAKKKEEQLTYLQMPIPNGRRYSRAVKRSWSGLNYRQTLDTGAMSMECNISTAEAPYLTPSQSMETLNVEHTDEFINYHDGTTTKPISIFGFDDFLLVIYEHDTYSATYPSHTLHRIKADYITYDENGDYVIYTGVLKRDNLSEESYITDKDRVPRSVVQFNLYDTPTDPLSGEYVKKLIIFPDKKVMDFKISSDFEFADLSVDVIEYSNETAETDESEATIYPPPDTASKDKYYFNTYNNDIYHYTEYIGTDGGTYWGWKVTSVPTVPDIQYATVHLSRIFGVGNGRVYASGYNSYSNWNLDTVGEYNESNAWCSPSQSNVKADGDFTGITTYQNHIVCFKRDFMHEIYNTKNPFRIVDVYADGAIDNRTIQEVNGRLIFVADDAVKVYTGAKPRILSYNLGIDKFRDCVAGADGRNYYLYTYYKSEHRLFVYDTVVEQWSERQIPHSILGFAYLSQADTSRKTLSAGMYALCYNGNVYHLDTGVYAHNWSFETDLITNETVDIKHIKKLQMLAEVSGGSFKVYLLYDDETFDENSSHLVYSSNRQGLQTVRVKPRKTANYGFKFHVQGYGYVKLYELEVFLEQGGGIYV